jgi:hypothetical protein
VAKKESQFQKELIDELHVMFPGCLITKNDSEYIQGFPDITIFYENRWATLEVKRSKGSPDRPNQPYYVDRMNKMSFSRFIYPENKEEVLSELQQAFSF